MSSPALKSAPSLRLLFHGAKKCLTGSGRGSSRAALAVFASTVFALTSCTQSDVVVVKLAPNVETRHFDIGLRPPEAAPPQHNECANTNWFFRCNNDFEFDTVSSEEKPGACTVTIKIKKVHLKLDLPIVMYLPVNATDRVKAHELGHVKICEKAYQGAYDIAYDAGKKVIGKDFTATSKTMDQAFKLALREAGQEIGRQYRSQTVDRVNIVSSLYDRITSTKNDISYVSTAIDQAWAEYDELSRRVRDNPKTGPDPSKEGG